MEVVVSIMDWKVCATADSLPLLVETPWSGSVGAAQTPERGAQCQRSSLADLNLLQKDSRNANGRLKRTSVGDDADAPALRELARGGALVSLVGPIASLTLDAISFAAGASLLRRLPVLPPSRDAIAASQDAPRERGVGAGFQHIFRTRPLALLYLNRWRSAAPS